MAQQLTITIDEQIYNKLQRKVGANHISEHIESLLQSPNEDISNLEVGYRSMAEDEAHDAQAMKWSEAMIGDINLA